MDIILLAPPLHINTSVTEAEWLDIEKYLMFDEEHGHNPSLPYTSISTTNYKCC